MASISLRRFASRGIGALTCLLALAPNLACAGVSSTTQIASYRVGGATASDLVSYMRRNPFHGDRGGAVANIRPNYSLSIVTRQSGGACRASAVNLRIRFVMTLPSAANASRMSPATRSAWNGFVAFARRHEERHRSIYLQCAGSFVTKAERLTGSNCMALNASIRRLLESEKRACDKRQLAFDRQDSGRLMGLRLFAMAGSPAGRAAKTRRPAPAVAKVIQVSAPATGLMGPR